MNWDVLFKWSTLGVGGLVGYLFGGWFVLLQFLFIAMLVDWVSGLLAGGVEGKLSSQVGFKGVAKKVMILCVVVAAHILDEILKTGNTIRDAAIVFYIANELLSITENAGRIGLPMPDRVKSAVAVLQGKSESK